MKVVIYTQYRENYGGAAEPHWKNKGGSTYVVEGLTVAQAQRAVSSGIPTLKSLIEYSNAGSSEHVIGVEVEDDAAQVGESWESPIVLSYIGGRWFAKEVTKNDEYGYLNQKISSMTRSYDMLPHGERENYCAIYNLRDGRVVSDKDLHEILKAA